MRKQIAVIFSIVFLTSCASTIGIEKRIDCLGIQFKNLAPARNWQLLSEQDAISWAAENLNVTPESQAATDVRQRIENAHKEVVIMIIVGSNLTHSGKVFGFIPAGENTDIREG